jgi:type II restriction enzyme
MASQLGLKYRSSLQIARVVSEDWAVRNLYCPACETDRLNQAPTNTRAIDLLCSSCNQVFQLKSSRTWNQRRIVDAAYAPMIAAIRSDKVPNLVFVHHTPSWEVQNVLLVPHFFFTENVIERRKPLSSTARRAGWVGCNILLSEVPVDGKLFLVANGVVEDVNFIRKRFQRMKSLEKLRVDTRGWVLEVLKAVRELGKREFTLSEVYAFESILSSVYPQNRNVRPKIRQQLQVLRDMGFLEFVAPGLYRLTETN